MRAPSQVSGLLVVGAAAASALAVMLKGRLDRDGWLQPAVRCLDPVLAGFLHECLCGPLNRCLEDCALAARVRCQYDDVDL